METEEQRETIWSRFVLLSLAILHLNAANLPHISIYIYVYTYIHIHALNISISDGRENKEIQKVVIVK